MPSVYHKRQRVCRQEADGKVRRQRLIGKEYFAVCFFFPDGKDFAVSLYFCRQSAESRRQNIAPDGTDGLTAGVKCFAVYRPSNQTAKSIIFAVNYQFWQTGKKHTLPSVTVLPVGKIAGLCRLVLLSQSAKTYISPSVGAGPDGKTIPLCRQPACWQDGKMPAEAQASDMWHLCRLSLDGKAPFFKSEIKQFIHSIEP